MNPALKKKLYHYAMVTLACAIMGIAMNTFYMPNKMLSGGIGGVAVLAYYVAGLPMGATSLICNVPLFFLAYKYMDREYTVSALYGIIAFSVSLDFFHFLSTYTVVHDKLLACIAGGVLYGIGAACMYRVGGSSGGTDIIGAIIQKNYSISISTTGFAFNICLLLASVSLFGIEPVLYTLLTFFVMTKLVMRLRQALIIKRRLSSSASITRRLRKRLLKSSAAVLPISAARAALRIVTASWFL